MELKGKIIDFLGDSITEGVGVYDQNNRYDNIVHRRLELAAHYNYGIGGTRLAHQSAPSETPRYDLCFCGRAYLLEKSADLIVVYGGVNDYIHGDAYFGKMEDRTPDTFCGAVYFLMNFLKTNYEGKQIVFMTPAHMHFKGISDKCLSGRPIKKPDAQPLSAYVEVIKARGKELGIPVLDLFEKLPIDPNNESDREKYTVDGLHFNDDGHEILANTLCDFLESL
ncbi:MAG: SGNH/GDSL hydrolase family protein [Clostridia bacterium]|nr:SGNH/GDSL hydrolase family protein [Clostridia bacterium]